MIFLKKILPFLFLFIIFLIPILDLFKNGFPLTHDGDVHLLRLTNFYQSLQEGNLIPRWAANVNYGFGQPIFEFFYPLPYYIASILHFFGLSFANSIKIILGFSLIGSGFTMFFWLSKITPKNGAILGSLLYVFAPFRFVDVYVRGDIGESLAFIFIPLILYFLYQIAQKITIIRIILGGAFLALLILCHNVVSLMFMPFFLWYGFFLWLKKKDFYTATSIISIFFIGLGLAAFFWIPGLFEAKFTLRNIVTAGEYKDRFITFKQLIYGPWSYAGSGYFTVQLGIMHWVVFVLSLFSLPILFVRKSKNIIFILSLIIFNCLGIFLMFPQSNFIWSKFLLLQNFQFPWRFLVLPIFSLSVIGAFLLNMLFKKISFLILALSICLIIFINNTYWHVNKFVIRPDNYFSGIQKHPADTGESTPLWGIRFMESGFKQPLETLSGKAQIMQLGRASTKHTYKIIALTKVRLLENTLYFPGWEVLVDGNSVDIEFQDVLHRGLITFNLNKGEHIVDISFKNTKFRSFADIISLITFVTIIFTVCIKTICKKK